MAYLKYIFKYVILKPRKIQVLVLQKSYLYSKRNVATFSVIKKTVARFLKSDDMFAMASEHTNHY